MKGKKTASKYTAFLVLWISAAALCGLMMQKFPGDVKRIVVQTFSFAFIAGVLFWIKRDKLDLSYLRCKSNGEVAYYVFAAVMLLVFIPFFRNALVPSDVIDGVAKKLGIASEWIYTGIPVMLACLSFPIVMFFLKVFLRDWLDVPNIVYKKNKHLIKPTLILAAIYCIAIIAIIRADFAYKDDVCRLLNGSTFYDRESRFVAEFATFLVHFDEYFADTSPLPQIVEMILMAIAVMVIYSVLYPGKKPRVVDYFAMVPFALTPYFYECVSFKYDSPQHALALIFSVFPLLFINEQRKKFIAVTVICIPMVCMSHQVLMAFFPSMVILLCVLKWNRGEWTFKESAVRALEAAGAYIIGAVIFRLGIMRVLPSGTNFTSTEMYGIKELIPGMIQNYKAFILQIFSDFSTVWLFFIGVLCVTFVFRIVHTSILKKMASITVALVCIVILFLLSFSLYPLLTYPQYMPRHIYSFGLFIGILALVSVVEGDEKAIVAKVCAVMLACCFFVFGFTYGNALSQQKEYTEYRMEMVLETLTEITEKNTDKVYTVQVKGTTGFAPMIDNMPKSMNMIRRLIPVEFSENFARWSASPIYQNYGLNIISWGATDDPDYLELDLPLYEENYYYSIYAEDYMILIVLEDR